MAFSALLASLLAASTLFQAAAVSDLKNAAADSVGLRFYRDNGRLLATVDRGLLKTDFVVRAQTLTVARIAKTSANAAEPSVGARRISGALQLRHDGDSLLLMEYAGTTRGQLQYRRRATMAVLRYVNGAFVVDAAPLWAAVKPATLRDISASSRQTAWVYDGNPFQPGIVLPGWSDKPVVVQPIGGYEVRYGLSIDRLPAVPMRPRLADPRVLIASIAVKAEGADSMDSTKTVQYLLRRRLEKKDPTAAVSDVVQPIIYRITSSVPEKLIPGARHAVEVWKPVFESIGFRNAIVVRLPTDPPAAKGERESQITYEEYPAPGATAGPSYDPRTGELLTVDILITSATAPFLQRGYFALAGLTNTKARYPFPDSLVASIFATPLIHEMGHTFGFDHNYKGAGVYPTDSLRNRDFLRRMGTMASVMSYSPFNYVPQLEDGMGYADFFPSIGVYDYWAIGWGYRPIPEAATPRDELPTLERWRAEQDKNPYFQSSLEGIVEGLRDPYDQSDIIGNDLIKSTQYGIRNIGRLATAIAKDTMEDMPTGRYGLLDRWGVILRPVARVIGGQLPKAPYAKDPNKIQWEPIDPTYQVQAFRYMLRQLFYAESEVVKVAVGGSASSSPTTPVLFDSVAPGWDASLGQRVQRALVADLLNLDHLKQMLAQMSPTQRQEVPALCRELATLEQQLVEAEKSPIEMRADEAKTLRPLVTAVLDPKGGFCQ